MALIGAILTVLGAFLLYLGARHQKLMRPLGPFGKCSAVIVLGAGLALLLGSLGPAAAVFAWMIGAMLVWTIAPLTIAWWRGAPDGK
ncbi:MAG: hypothetical protein JSR91_26530 [Proteobacteria bacterium]|nr:hypothetical protein [Pseudomonadota bacterium]